MAEQLENPQGADKGKSSVDYDAMYREAHPNLEPDKAMAEAMAYGEKPRTEEAMLLQEKEALFY